MRTSAASEHRLDRLVGRRQLLNWRWWVALLPVVAVLVALHGTAAVCQVCADVSDWASFRWFRAGRRLMLWCEGFTTRTHAWVFHAPPNG